jgi:hypothetical protein
MIGLIINSFLCILLLQQIGRTRREQERMKQLSQTMLELSEEMERWILRNNPREFSVIQGGRDHEE